MTDASTTPNATTEDRGCTLVDLTLFIVGSAVLYSTAMILMKLWGQMSPLLMLTLIGTLMGAGIWLEISALQTERLGMVYLMILGAEVVIIAAASALWFGEEFTAREVAGGALIVVGTALAWS